MVRIVFHIDVNSAFLSRSAKQVLEQGYKVDIRDIVSVVCVQETRKGIVMASSAPAKKIWIKAPMRIADARKIFPWVKIAPPDYKYYKKCSDEMMNILKSKFRLFQQFSIDECFVEYTEDMQREYWDPVDVANQIREYIKRKCGFTVNVWVWNNKFLAKMASDMKKPNGLTIIRKKDSRKMLSPLPIDSFFGIGKKTAPRLKELGINTIGDLINRIDEDDNATKEVFGKFYYVIKDWIDGKGGDEINTEPWDPKSVGHSTTLFSDALSVEELEKPLKELSEEVSRDAKREGKKGKTVQLVLKDNEFKIINRSKRLGKLSNEFEDIYKIAYELLKANYDGRPIRLIGVTLQQLQNPKETYEQLSILDNYEQIKEENETRLLIGDLNRLMHKSVFKTMGDHLKENPNGTKRSRWDVFWILTCWERCF